MYLTYVESFSVVGMMVEVLIVVEALVVPRLLPLLLIPTVPHHS